MPWTAVAGVPEEAMRILEQGASNLQGGGEGSAEAVGLLMLAMSTLLYRRYGALHHSLLFVKCEQIFYQFCGLCKAAMWWIRPWAN